MNSWLIAAAVLAVGLAPCGVACLRGETMPRLVALELASTVAAILMVLLAEGYGLPSMYDLSLSAALLSLPAILVFAHFLERWL